MKQRPHILSIAGFDPSSGAGLTADIKTFEASKCYGLSVCTANTIQNDVDFEACHWISEDTILAQIGILFKRFKIDYVKIGIVENWRILSTIVKALLQYNPAVKIILDPVLTSSSAFHFHNTEDATLDEVLEDIYMITPNYKEIEQLYPSKTFEATIDHISKKTNLYLKGGHNTKAIGKDELYLKDGNVFTLQPKLKNCTEKHGSGCILSSAITSYLALGFPILKACYRGKRYTEKVLNSNKTLLGYHG